MDKVAEYLRHSAECNELASKAQPSEIRRHYLMLAEMWKQLAHERRSNLDGSFEGAVKRS